MGEEAEESGQNISAGKELGQKTLKSLKRGLGKLWRRHRGNVLITEYDPCYKVAYLGNVLTGWAKGEGCVEKPVSTLWKNYVSSNRPDVTMRLTITNGGLTATTKDHGLTEYWAHRVTYCVAPASHPRLFVWVYRHEGRRLRPELRCHAALCSKESTARRLASTLNTRLQQALLEFRRDKVSRQNARLSLANSVYENPSLPRRKILLSIGGQNYRPPLERSKSAPKLSAIEEDAVAEEIEQQRLLEELRSFENVARNWHVLVDVLNRADASSEYLDENGSISSGCDTASTSASSEERADDNQTTIKTESRTSRRVFFSDEVIRSSANSSCLRRNSEGSLNFITCNGSPRFHCARNIGRKRYSSSSRNEDNDLNDDEIREQELTPQTSSNVFEFDTVVFQELVEYSPQGSESTSGRRIDVKGEKYPGRVDQIDEFLEEEDDDDDDDEEELPFGLQEEGDSDESGYVEAPPKSLIGPEDINKEMTSLDTKLEKRNDSNNSIITSCDSNKKKLSDINGNEDSLSVRKNINNKFIVVNKNNNSSNDSNNNLSTADKFQETFDDTIKLCPISETIKKLANASLKSSKSLDISTSNCLKAINSLKNSKSFDGIRTESPSLFQRKQLLAQQGVC